MAKLNKKNIYNPETKETLNQRLVFGGDPDGTLNFTRMKFEWALRVWDIMEKNTWFPKEVQMTQDAKDYKNLTPAEKRMYDLVLSQLIFMDSLQTNNIMDNINPYITAPEINACLSRQSYEECLVGETEVLTPNGWVRLDCLKEEDEVLQVDIEQKSEFVKPLKLIKNKYKGTLYNFNGRGFSQIVTENHRMMYRNRSGQNKEKLAKDFPIGKLGSEFIASTFKNGDKTSLTDYEKFLIALQADGTILLENKEEGTNKNRNGNKNGMITVTFTFSKERKIKKLKELLLNLNFTFRETKYKKHFFSIKIPKNLIISKSFKDWVNLNHINYSWAQEFLEELKYWDGWDYNNISFGYDTTNKDNIDIVEIIASFSGYKSSRYTKIDKRKESFKDLHRITFKRKYDYISRGTVSKEEITDFEGNVYCVKVPSGFFLVKHNGYVSVTGNCNHSKSYAVMVESISENTDEIYNMWKTDKVLLEKNKFIAYVYQQLAGEVTDEKLLLALFANQILEGIYFYSGFAALYSLAKSGKMLGSSQMIKFIQRDEVTHLLLFQNMINSVRETRPELFTKELKEKVLEMFDLAVQYETNWGKYITQNNILGFTDAIIDDYIRYLADQRLVAVGFEKRYNRKNPISWVDAFSSFDDQKTNFFEGNAMNYSKASVEMNDGDFGDFDLK